MAMDYEVLDRIARDYSLSRTRDFAVGEIDGFMVSIIKDLSGINEVNLVFKGTDGSQRRKIISILDREKKDLGIVKYRLKDENLSMVMAKTNDKEKEYESLRRLLESVTGSLKGVVSSPDVTSMKKVAAVEAEEVKFKEVPWKKVLKEILAARGVAMSVGVFIVMLLWYYNGNLYWFNMVIAFLTPFILDKVSVIFRKVHPDYRELLTYSAIVTPIGIYAGSVIRLFRYYGAEFDEPLRMAFDNVNRAIIYGDTMKGYGSVLLPLIAGTALAVISTYCVRFINERSGR